MLLQRHHSRFCRSSRQNRAHNNQAQRVFKTAPLYAVTNPEESAPQDIWTAFTAFFESLWSPTTAATQKAGMSYVYDEDGTLIADTLTGGAATAWGQSARYIHFPTASGPMPIAAIYGTKHYAIQSDHLNTPSRLIQSDGQVAWQWAYSAFGEEKPTIAKNRFANADLNQSFGTSTVAAVTFNLRYPGQYFDQECGLHYNYHRSYSATVGRYTQADPIGLDGGWNRFGYVDSDPLSFTDPFGLVKIGQRPIEELLLGGGGGGGGSSIGGSSGGSGSLGGAGARAAGAAAGLGVAATIDAICRPDKPDCEFKFERYFSGSCKTCVYVCKSWGGGPVTYQQAKDIPCPSIRKDGLVNTDEIAPICRGSFK